MQSPGNDMGVQYLRQQTAGYYADRRNGVQGGNTWIPGHRSRSHLDSLFTGCERIESRGIEYLSGPLCQCVARQPVDLPAGILPVPAERDHLPQQAGGRAVCARHPVQQVPGICHLIEAGQVLLQCIRGVGPGARIEKLAHTLQIAGFTEQVRPVYGQAPGRHMRLLPP